MRFLFRLFITVVVAINFWPILAGIAETTMFGAVQAGAGAGLALWWYITA